MVAHAETTFDRLDVLFNNAGVMLPGDDDAVSTEESVWDRTMSINAKGVFLGCKHGIPALRARGRVGDQHRLLRRRHGGGHSAARLHREQGRGAGPHP